MTDTLDILWLRTLEELGDRAAHEIKDTLNGVSLSLEVVRGRSAGGRADHASSVSDFAAAAAAQLELVTERVEAMLALSRRPREPVDLALALRRLAALLVPAAKADGGLLRVEGANGSVTTPASGQAVRLALGSALLSLVRTGGGTCLLEPVGAAPGSGTSGTNGCAVVRFSHESAQPSIDPEIISAIGEQAIRVQHGTRGSGGGMDTLLVFPVLS